MSRKVIIYCECGEQTYRDYVFCYKCHKQKELENKQHLQNVSDQLFEKGALGEEYSIARYV